jgi:hypothetical protein
MRFHDAWPWKVCVAEPRQKLSTEHWIESISTQLSILAIIGIAALAFAPAPIVSPRTRTGVSVEILKTRPSPMPLPRENPVLGQ